MAVLFVLASPGRWSARELADRAVALCAGSAGVSLRGAGGAPDPGGPVLIPCAGACGGEWALLVPPGRDVRVNDTGCATGIRLLRHRDAIRLPGAAPAYFSCERLAGAVRFAAAADAVYCARCKAPVEPGQPAVQCPACGVRHHEDPARERACWTYAGHCAVCDQTTPLDTGFRWTPEDL